MSGPRIGSLFSGYGGLELGVQAVLGGTTAWHVEFDENPSRILAHHWPDVPNYGDITAVDWESVEPVDILTGGFPCQDVSLAGARRGMVNGTRSGLWSEFARAIATLRPSLVVIENVRGLFSADGEPWHAELTAAAAELASTEIALTIAQQFATGNPARRKEGTATYVDRWSRAVVRLSRQRKRQVARFDRERRLVRRAIDTVLRDLADMGFNAEWGGIRAADAGAPHGRFRIFILAWPTDPERVEPERKSPQIGRLAPPPGSGRGTHADPESGGRRLRAAENDGSPARDVDSPRDAAPLHATADPTGTRRGEGQDSGASAGDEGAHRGGGVEPQRGIPTPAGAPTQETRPATGDVAPSASELRPPLEWGPYSAAVNRWELITGRAAPAPTIPGPSGSPRLSPYLVEWMMGLPEGWVTDPAIWHGLSEPAARNAQLKALGNGVVWQQAALATRILLERASR